MNYLEIINKCLSELNYKQVKEFSELIKPEHERIKNNINLIQQEICTSENWNFLLRDEKLTLPKNTDKIDNTINGRILAVYIDNVKYEYCEDFQKFFAAKKHGKIFSIFNDKLLFPEFEEEKLINIIYYTRNTAFTSAGTEKVKLEDPEDRPIIPLPFIEPILVYGTCMRLKGNPEHIKYGYWLGMYNSAIAALRSKAATEADYAPSIKIVRRECL